MKKIMITLVFVLVCSAVFSQDTTRNHNAYYNSLTQVVIHLNEAESYLNSTEELEIQFDAFQDTLRMTSFIEIPCQCFRWWQWRRKKSYEKEKIFKAKEEIAQKEMDLILEEYLGIKKNVEAEVSKAEDFIQIMRFYESNNNITPFNFYSLSTSPELLKARLFELHEKFKINEKEPSLF